MRNVIQSLVGISVRNVVFMIMRIKDSFTARAVDSAGVYTSPTNAVIKIDKYIIVVFSCQYCSLIWICTALTGLSENLGTLR